MDAEAERVSDGARARRFFSLRRSARQPADRLPAAPCEPVLFPISHLETAGWLAWSGSCVVVVVPTRAWREAGEAARGSAHDRMTNEPPERGSLLFEGASARS